MKKEYLPIGSVVLLKNTKKRLMITGFYVKPNDSNTYFDYLGCIYPEGMVSEHDNYIFNNEQIEEVCFKGLVDEEEENFKTKLYEIIGEKREVSDNSVISIPIQLYEEYNTQENDIISIPLDEYNESRGIISIPADLYAQEEDIIRVPADLYEKACGTEVDAADVISIPAKLYKEYNYEGTGADVISIPADLYDKELHGDKKKKKKNKKRIISVPYEAYRQANGLITIPYKKYKKMLKTKNVIKINAKTYQDFIDKQNGVIRVPADEYKEATNQKMISIPANVYKKLREKENVISIPLNVYEKVISKESNDVISIPLSEYEKLTRGTESNGIITLPSSVYEEMLRKEKSGIDESKELIEIPFDLYKKTQIDN